MASYSPSVAPALLCVWHGAHGAYHAGVLRALHEAGVKIDVLAGHGTGAGGAMLAAIAGGSRPLRAKACGVVQDEAVSLCMAPAARGCVWLCLAAADLWCAFGALVALSCLSGFLAQMVAPHWRGDLRPSAGWTASSLGEFSLPRRHAGGRARGRAIVLVSVVALPARSRHLVVVERRG